MGKGAMEVDPRPLEIKGWIKDVRDVILAEAAHFDLEPRDPPGILIHIPCAREGLGRLSVSWYIGVKRYGFLIQWPIAAKPTVEWMRARVHAHFEDLLGRGAGGR